MDKSIPASTLRKKLFHYINEAAKPDNPVTVTVDGEPKVVMLSVEDYDGLIETLEIMSDKEFMKGVERGLKDIKEGRVHALEDVIKDLNL